MPDERYEEIRGAALGLSEADRANLAHDLFESIESRYDDGGDAEWGAEIRSRFDDIVEERVETVPGEEVFALLAADREGVGVAGGRASPHERCIVRRSLGGMASD